MTMVWGEYSFHNSCHNYGVGRILSHNCCHNYGGGRILPHYCCHYDSGGKYSLTTAVVVMEGSYSGKSNNYNIEETEKKGREEGK